MTAATRFECPACGAIYALVRVEVDAVKSTDQLACRSCGGPLDSYDGRFILKYFLIDRPPRPKRSPVTERRRLIERPKSPGLVTFRR
jgi:hypothetical protein